MQLKKIQGSDNVRLDAFSCAAGTGGTIAGCGKHLKSAVPGVRIILSDCDGSCLGTYIGSGELKTREGECASEVRASENNGGDRSSPRFAEN